MRLPRPAASIMAFTRGDLRHGGSRGTKVAARPEAAVVVQTIERIPPVLGSAERLPAHSGLPMAGRPNSDACRRAMTGGKKRPKPSRSEEHTSELQSRGQLVCRLLL